MTQAAYSVQWPAIIKLHADHELLFISNAAHFASDAMLQLTRFQSEDMLIDSSGAVCRVRNDVVLTLMDTGIVLSLDDVEALLRLHLANNGNCCVSKFHANSIYDAFINVFA